jgi:iron complex transport system substrate-binding protein
MTKVAERIASFLPSATEMIYALGLEDRLVGVTHECDFPPAAQEKPIVVRSVLPVETMSQAEIDVAVSARMRDGESLYQVDEALMRYLAPDLIVTQDLCQVCAPSGNEVSKVVHTLDPRPEVLFLTPKSLDGVLDNILVLGKAAGVAERAQSVCGSLRARLEAVQKNAARATTRPRVFCMEWLDPVYCSGHWVPEMVQLAGGEDALGRRGTDSVRIAWQDVVDWAPEVMVVMPCGFHLDDAIKASACLGERPKWADIPAVRNGRVFIADASSYFARPGPRLADGTELLAHLIHPELFEWTGPADAYRALPVPADTRTGAIA